MWFKTRYSMLKDDLKLAWKELDKERDERRKYQRMFNDASTTLQQAKTDISSKVQEIEKLKNLVRQQTDADLLINAMKAVGIIKADPAVNHANEENRLMAIRQAAGIQAATTNSAYYLGCAQGLNSFLRPSAFYG